MHGIDCNTILLVNFKHIPVLPVENVSLLTDTIFFDNIWELLNMYRSGTVSSAGACYQCPVASLPVYVEQLPDIIKENSGFVVAENCPLALPATKYICHVTNSMARCSK